MEISPRFLWQATGTDGTLHRFILSASRLMLIIVCPSRITIYPMLRMLIKYTRFRQAVV